MRCRLLVSAVTLIVAHTASVSAARAQQAPATGAEAPPAPPAASGSTAQGCAGGCPAGTLCHQGQCVSACNPPCPAGATCTAAGECAYPPSALRPAVAAPQYVQPPPPRTLPYREGPPPAGYELQSRSTPWLWAPGVGLLAGTYLASALLGALASAFNNDSTLFIPFAGPFIYGASCDGCTGGGRALLYALGAGQIIGTGLLITGFVVRRERFVRTAQLDVWLGPTWLAGDAPGLELSGRF